MWEQLTPLPNKTGSVVAKQIIAYVIKFIRSEAAPRENDRAELLGMKRMDNDENSANRNILYIIIISDK